MKNKDLYIGMVYKKIDIDIKDITIFIPNRACFGMYDEKNKLFYDRVSNSLIPNMSDAIDFDLSDSFGNVYSYKTLSKTYKKLNLKDIIEDFTSELKNFVFVYDAKASTSNEQITEVEFEDLYDDYGIELTIPDYAESYKEIMELRKSKEDYMNGEPDSNEEANENAEIKVEKISKINEELKQEIISQDAPIKKILTAIYKNTIFGMKSNILIYGPTGVGKTQILKSLSKKLNMPLWIEDMTKYTEAGYKGGDVEDILYNLYINAKENLALAEKSILVLDEIDKKAGTNGDSAVSKSDVLKSLLSIIEGGKFEVSKPSLFGHEEKFTFDTSNLTVIACGAFTDLRKDIQKPVTTIGFGSSTPKALEKVSDKIDMTDFVKFGMPEEFMGRFKTIIKMNSLDKDDFIKILKNSSISPLKKYKTAFEKLGINMEFNDKIYDVIATKALTYNTGARALNIVVDELFEDSLYDIFDENYSAGNLSIEIEEKDTPVLTMKKKEKIKRESSIDA